MLEEKHIIKCSNCDKFDLRQCDLTYLEIYECHGITLSEFYERLKKIRGLEKEILKEEYNENMRIEEVIKLALKCIVKSLEEREEKPRMKIALIPTSKACSLR